jgi:hypothetical integral membrane protein (TIGR02206 family)
LGVRQFSIAHLAALAVLVLAAVLAVVAPRRWPGPWVRFASWALAAAIFVGWVGENVAEVVEGIWTVQYSLPLQLTDAVSLSAILALTLRKQLLVELVYFWTFSASIQAVLTPDVSNTFPNVLYFTYFLYHVGSVLAAFLLVFGCRIYPRRGAALRVYAITLAFAVVAGTGDVITGGNYMYLRTKPIHRSLLNVMGPWPLYIVAGAALGLVIFLALAAIADAVARHDAGWSAARRAEISPPRSAPTGTG